MNNSCYRLGDLIIQNLDETIKSRILKEYPNSFGSKYIIEKENNGYFNNIDIITEIVLQGIEEYKHLLPNDIENSTVVHLRIGDVVSGNAWFEQVKKPLDVEYYNIVPTNKKIYVIGKCHFGDECSQNYEESIDNSNKYLSEIIKLLNAKHFDSGNADIDLCCAVKSKLFIQGRGFYSKLIVEIRKKLNLENIETEVFDLDLQHKLGIFF